MADAPQPPAQDKSAPAGSPDRGGSEEEPEVELSLAHYFGGYAIIFLGVIGLAMLFVLLTKLMR